MSLHPLVLAAAEGGLPPWAEVSRRRLKHMGRVADLLGAWAAGLGLSDDEVRRWRAAGFMHDVLREADPEGMRSRLTPLLADLPAGVLHGPAAAERLRGEGVTDEPFLRAVAYHTIGHPDLDRLGRAVYAADFLEPDRKHLVKRRAELRARMLQDPRSVVAEVAKFKIRQLLDAGRPIRAETWGFWNVLVRESDG